MTRQVSTAIRCGRASPCHGSLLPAYELPVLLQPFTSAGAGGRAATEWLTPARQTGYDTLMAQPLAPLRPELDIMPSPVPDQPGLLIRDPFHYSDATIIVPPLLARALVFFDGEHSDLDLREFLTRATGDLRVTEAVRDLIDTMTECGFLVSQEFHEMRDQKQRQFAEAGVRQPAHAGTTYPAEADALREKLRDYGAGEGSNSAAPDSLVALAAPHVSPEGGFRSYAAAYGRLGPQYVDKTFVILGTSHYGQPEKFGLTRKPFVTPLGTIQTARISDLELRLEHGTPSLLLKAMTLPRKAGHDGIEGYSWPVLVVR